MALTNFPSGTTKNFSVVLSIDDVAQDITGDEVQFLMKSKKADPDSEAVIDADADVVTSGAGGTALFTLSPADTAITPGDYYWDVQWRLAGGAEYVPDNGRVKVLERVSDL